MDKQKVNEVPRQQQPATQTFSKPKKSSKLPILIVIFIILIAAAGYGGYYYGHKDVSSLHAQVTTLNGQVQSLSTKLVISNKKLTTTNASTSSNSTNQLNQNIIKIPTLGVQIVVPNAIKDLTTTPVSSPGNYNGEPVTSVTVSTTTISNDIPACKNVAFGTLTKYQGLYPSSGVNLTVWHQQFSGYYLALSPGEASCAPSSTSQTNQDLLQAQSAVFDATLPSTSPAS